MARRAGASGAGAEPCSRGSSDADEEEAEATQAGRSRRGASALVSGLLSELYSGARGRPRDSLDSSTEASASSDAFPGSRGGGGSGSGVLQELQRTSGQRHQRRLLAQKDISELTTVIRELNYRICVQSAKLLRLLKQKDRLLHKVQRNCDIVTASLQAVSPKRPWPCAIHRYSISTSLKTALKRTGACNYPY